MNEEIKQQNTLSSKNSYSGVRFFISEQMLKADFTADILDTPLNQETIQEELRKAELSQHQLSDDVLLNLISNSESNYDEEISIEKHSDASFELVVDKNQMNLAIKVESAQGGKELIFDEVFDALLEANVKPDFIDKEQLMLSLANHENEVLPIATGVEPINGEDSRFEVLFKVDTKKDLMGSHDGNINHYETHDYISIELNSPVMKRIPHTKATVGSTVFGEDIDGDDGKQIDFTLDDTVAIDSSNSDLLVTAKKGHPFASDKGVHIDDTLTIKNASLRSGNIYFDGSVEITGEVMPNVVIEATGDIHVQGMVENARLIAGNDITVCAGILSTKLYDHNSNKDFTPECSLVAQGTITVKYCNSICATAKKDILIETYTMHSHLKAGGEIIIGNNNGKGVNMGMAANIFGSEAYVITHLICGKLKDVKQKNKKIINALKRNKSEMSLLKTVLNRIKSKGSPAKVGSVILQKAKKIHDEIKLLKNKVLSLEAELILAKKELYLSKNVKININKKLYPNVHITINEANAVSKREHDAAVISCENYEIQFN